MTPKDKVDILTLTATGENPVAFAWGVETTRWAEADVTDKTNLFSRVGIGVKTAMFVMHPVPGLDAHKAMHFGGRHCFITDIHKSGPTKIEVKTALIEPVTCRIKHTQKSGRDDRGKPAYIETDSLIFPACITEKWMGYSQLSPQAEVGATYVLVTPKVIVLSVGDLVSIDGMGIYKIQVAHTLDEYKNEFEITAETEV